jgi:hypothetical protein
MRDYTPGIRSAKRGLREKQGREEHPKRGGREKDLD